MPEEEMKKDIIKRLKTFGVLYNDLEEGWLMKFIIQKVVNHVTSECNVDCIPCELYEKTINMICGEFLYEKRSQGKLKLDEIDLNGMISSIKVGDTQVNFSSENISDVQRVDILIDLLKNSIDVSDYIAFRRFKW